MEGDGFEPRNTRKLRIEGTYVKVGREAMGVRARGPGRVDGRREKRKARNTRKGGMHRV